MPQLGPEDLPDMEDKVLYYLVEEAGADAPAQLGSGVSDYDLSRLVGAELQQASDARGVMLAAITSLESHGLAKAMKVMGGPWTVSPTKSGRDQVRRWKESWRTNAKAVRQRIRSAILEELERQRHANPGRHRLEGKLDLDALASRMEVNVSRVISELARMKEEGVVEENPVDQLTLSAGYASVTNTGLAELEAGVGRRPAAELERAWNEVARLKKEASRTISDLIADPELRVRTQDLLAAPGHFDRVLREASVVLESRIRKLTGSKAQAGVAVMEQAFSPKAGPLALSTDPKLQQAAMQLYASVMGFIRNDVGHGLKDEVTEQDAWRFVAMVDLLLSWAERAAAKSPTPPKVSTDVSTVASPASGR
jgi:uncharacterized protein (TIGR02391 family)